MTTENPTPNDTPADDTALGSAAAQDVPPADPPKPGEDAPADKPAGDDAEKPADDKPTDDKPAAAEGAPEEYDIAAFKMPEVDGKTLEFDTEGFEAVAPTLKELNLSQDQAGKLVGIYAEKVVPLIQKRTLDAIDNQAAELRANLARDLQADPEVGGKKLDESRSLAAKAIAHFIPDKNERDDFSKFLNESGFGNQKHLLRVIAGAGRMLGEAQTPPAETASAPLTEAQKFYGSQGKG